VQRTGKKDSKMITVGADPEVFVANQEGKIISARPFVHGGTKEHPFALRYGVGVHHDNVALEFSFPPADEEEEFVKNVDLALMQMQLLIGENNLLIKPAVLNSEMAAWIPKQEEFLEFACDPEEYLYLEDSFLDIKEAWFRSAGGHVHIGWPNATDQQKSLVVSVCDYTLGAFNVLLEDESGVTRRHLYGRAGSYRTKEYGIEYRTPGNSWLLSNKDIRSTFRLAKRSFEVAASDLIGDFEKVLPRNQLKTAINKGDKGTLLSFFKKTGLGDL
jgi:hypothetical protein